MKTKGFIFIVLLLSTSNFLHGQTAGTIKWTFETYSSVYSSPAIGEDGTIYIGSNDNRLYAINPDSTEKWEFWTSGDIESSPAIGIDGTIYVGSDNDRLYALNPDDGTKKWEFVTQGDVYSSPAIGTDGTIYVGSKDNKLYAITDEGAKKWEFSTGGDVTSSPAIGKDGTIYVGSYDNKLYAINSDGTVKWEYATTGDVTSSPAVGSDGTVYVGSYDNRLYAIDPDGTLKWRYITGGDVASSPAIGYDGTIYVGSNDNKLYAINPDGTLKWDFSVGYYIQSSPAIGIDGTIYVGSSNDSLYAINPDGTEKWSLPTGGWVRSSPTIDKDGTIYVGSNDYSLYAIYSDCGGLASSPWPKLSNNERNTGLAVRINFSTTFDVAMLDSGSSHMVSVDIINGEKGELIISDFVLTEADNFNVTSSLPLNIPAGSQGTLIFQFSPDSTEYYRNPFEMAYSVGSISDTVSGEAPVAIFIKDQSETAYVAEKAVAAFDLAKTNDETVALANNAGVIYRLLGEYDIAEIFLQNAVDSSLHKGYGFAGIKMNLGVVSSDLSQSTEANNMYDEAYADISSNESSSALAPQIYYNQAWEAYKQTNDTLVSNRANLVLAHSMANDYLKAKAYILFGALATDDENYPDAREKFRSAIDLDTDGPAGQIAVDNLTSISRPQILEEPISQFLCEGDSIMLKIEVFGEAPYTFHWYQGEELIKTVTAAVDSIIIQAFDATNDGDYRCIVENGFGTDTSSLFTLTAVIPEKPEVTPAGDTSICEGEAVILTAPYSTDYLWSNGAVTRSIRITDSGKYSLTITDDYGCVSPASDSVFIHVNPLPEKPEITTSGDISICEGEAVVLSASDASAYSWSNAESTRQISVTMTGSFSVTVINEHGCVSPVSDAVVVNVNPLPEKPSINIAGNTLISSSGTGNQWYFENAVINGAVDKEYTISQNGNYFVIVTNENGCSSSSDTSYFIVTNIQSIGGSFKLIIYPNPNEGSFNLRISDGFGQEKIELRLYNTDGRMVMNKILYYPQDSNEYCINAPDLISGLYHLQIVIGEKIYDEAIIIQK